MPTNAVLLIAALFCLVLFTWLVGVFLLFARVQEIQKKGINPQAASTSVTMAIYLENVQAADNFRNLFEVPVLFYTLGAVALATHHIPGWLVPGAWLFVALRVLHTGIHCTYNKVVHRLGVFLSGFGLLVGLWIAFFVSLPGVLPR